MLVKMGVDENALAVVVLDLFFAYIEWGKIYFNFFQFPCKNGV
jgi:hypothetical protein